MVFVKELLKELNKCIRCQCQQLIKGPQLAKLKLKLSTIHN